MRGNLQVLTYSNRIYTLYIFRGNNIKKVKNHLATVEAMHGISKGLAIENVYGSKQNYARGQPVRAIDQT